MNATRLALIPTGLPWTLPTRTLVPGLSSACSPSLKRALLGTQAGPVVKTRYFLKGGSEHCLPIERCLETLVPLMELGCDSVGLPGRECVNSRDACRRFGISAPAGCNWLPRFRGHWLEGLAERSRSPCASPRQDAGEIEAEIDFKVRAEERASGSGSLTERTTAAVRMWNRCLRTGAKDVPGLYNRAGS